MRVARVEYWQQQEPFKGSRGGECSGDVYAHVADSCIFSAKHAGC